MEISTDSSSGGGGSHHPNLPPGFRFHPTDEELVVHYLKKKTSSSPLPVSIIAEVDLYKYDPWNLPARATFGEHEWYFFSPRDRKYPNGARPNRAAISGYWKATGTDKPVMTSNGTQKVGVKKALVFYKGKPPKGVKTNWIMHEYRIVDNKTSIRLPSGIDLVNTKNSLRLDDWVLCRIYRKNNINKVGIDHESPYDNSMVMDEMIMSSIPPSLNVLGNNQGSKFYHPPNNISSTFNTTSSYELGLIGDTSNASSISQLASTSLNINAATAANTYSFKHPLPNQHLYWLNGEQDISSYSTSKRVPLHFLQSDNNVSSALGRLHSEAQQVSTSQTASLDQFNGTGVEGFRQPAYQLSSGLNWYHT